MILISEPIEAPGPKRWVKRPRALERKRGDGVIFDIIDEWISPLLAERIALQRENNDPESEA